MRKLTLILISILLVIGLITGCGKKDQGKSDVSDKKDVKITETTPLHLKYEMKGKETGSLDMYIKGKQMKMIITTKEANKDVSVVSYMKDNILYMITEEEGKKVGMKMTGAEIEEGMKDIMNIAKAKEMVKDYKKEGTEEILGYKCDVYKKGDESICLYQDFIALKYAKGDEVLIATAFEPDAKISDSDLEPPKDIEYMDMNEMMKNLDNMNK
ncbi:MAG: hypothetical protein N2490_03295 [Ignavibacteria bacterium]|nr:hypothetical protein [Ignavibacteria bacterium]